MLSAIDWNLVATTRLGRVLFMAVPDAPGYLEEFERRARTDSDRVAPLSAVIPVTERWPLTLPEELADAARRFAARVAPSLERRGFCMRVTRCGADEKLASAGERILFRAFVEELGRLGVRAWLAPRDPDAILSVQTAPESAGVALFTRAELERFPRLAACLAAASEEVDHRCA